MSKSNHQEKFLQLREQFPFLAFEKQEFSLTSAGLAIRYSFNLSGKVSFHPELFFPRKTFFLKDEELSGKLDAIIFNIGMIELISYWKAACSPKLIIRPFILSDAQAGWWKKLYYHGLGEFFYLNGISTSYDDFMEVENTSEISLILQDYKLDNSLLIPVGGGKDSAVTLELLSSLPDSIPLIMNPRGASLNTIAAKGFGMNGYLEVRRTIDPELLRLNDLGFLNGHTPFSALLAFVTVLAAILTGHRHIALSNESSANESTIEGTDINHQYSKSFAFESDFRDYIRNWISGEINYFSFLRPLGELQIAALFSHFRQYHPVFRSCNAGSKTDTWCGACAKCLFTCIILSPFLTQDELIRIFGKDLLDDYSLKPLFDQLSGIADEKPFDCVGTVKEVNLALCETIRLRKTSTLPALLAYYQNLQIFQASDSGDFTGAIRGFGKDHHLPADYEKILITSTKHA